MKHRKKEHYEQEDLQELIDTDAEYLMLLGERSNGKSYAVKWRLFKDWYEKGEEFIYLRRWDTDIKGKKVRDYFADLEQRTDGARPIYELTGGKWEYIEAYRGELFLARLNEDGTVTRDVRRIAHVMNLTGETHYKSGQFPKVSAILFEEFITATGYIPREVEALFSIVSTVFRRKRGRVYMIGNTLVPVCPYFNEWDIHIDKIKVLSISLITTRNR